MMSGKTLAEIASDILDILGTMVGVKDEDNMASDSDTHLATQQSIKAYVDAVGVNDLDDTTLTGAYLEDLLVYGSANKTTIVVCYSGYTSVSMTSALNGQWAPHGATASYWYGDVPLPTTKGSLKLYVKDVIIDGVTGFDAGSYIDSVVIYGWSNSASLATAVFTDAGNYTTNATHTMSNAAADDMSGYDSVHVLVTTQNADTSLRMGTPEIEYYYA